MDKMNANELRIGNLLLMESTLCEVVSIGIHNTIRLSSENFKFESFNLFESEIKPIPLTEDWLLKFGFEFSDLGDEPPYESYTLNKVEMWDYNGEYWICNCLDQAAINIEFKYVHQLQNLYFALTGDELTIKTI